MLSNALLPKNAPSTTEAICAWCSRNDGQVPSAWQGSIDRGAKRLLSQRHLRRDDLHQQFGARLLAAEKPLLGQVDEVRRTRPEPRRADGRSEQQRLRHRRIQPE
jgi:hypothetical protein